MGRHGLRRLAVMLSTAAATIYWVANALVLGPRLGCQGGPEAFLGNVAVGVTFVTSGAVASAAYALVLGRDIVLGRDALAGVSRLTLFAPFGLGLGLLSMGAGVSVLALRVWLESGWAALLRAHGPSLLLIGAAFALMGSLVGNLAGSVTLDARDLGRITRVNLVLLVSNATFWLSLMWAVLHLAREGMAGLMP